MNHEAAIHFYYRCFEVRDREGLERILSPDFRHVSPFGVHEHRTTMLDQIWPAVGRSWARDIRIFGTAPEFMVRYSLNGDAGGSMAEYVRFENEMIAEIEVFVGRN